MDEQLLTYTLYALVAGAAILLAEAGYLSWASRRGRKIAINRRLRQMERSPSTEEVLLAIRRERGLSETGAYAYPSIFLNRLFLQSGIRGNPVRFFSYFLAAGLIATLVLDLLFFPRLPAFLIGAGIAFACPLIVLNRARARRLGQIAEQLPLALDVVVRSLRAGHPTPVSLALVAREMGDPIGTEFGMVSDELTYGLDIDTAMRNLAERAGLEDLRLLAAAMSVQSTTGGNLVEVLANLSHVIRERLQMRRKIRAVSAEGRASAVLLSLLPFILFGLLQLIAPSFYTAVWGHPIVVPVLTGAILWGLIGDYILYRMVNFDF